MKRNPPSLVSLAVDSAIHNLPLFSDLSFLPDHILLDLFLKTLRAGKLTEKILKLFVATGKEEILAVIAALNIQYVSTPVLPTNRWPFISQFHLIIVQDPDRKEEFKIPGGFNIDVYKTSVIVRMVGSSSISALFSGNSCRCVGYLMFQQKYVTSIDDDCIPAEDTKGNLVDVVAQHITNLKTPATPLFCNTLYDPFCKGTDFVRGYALTLKGGVPSALSCGLWLNLAHYDAPTQALKPEQTINIYVDDVLTIAVKTLMLVSGINIAVDRELLGPTLLPSF